LNGKVVAARRRALTDLAEQRGPATHAEFGELLPVRTNGAPDRGPQSTVLEHRVLRSVFPLVGSTTA